MVVALALGSALGYALASVWQQRAASAVPAGQSMRLSLLWSLARRPAWVGGIVADIAGYGMQFAALATGSLVVVQPLLVSGLLFALPLGAWLGGGRMGRQEWTGAALVVVGLAVFLVAADPATGRDDTSGMAWVVVATATLVPVGALLIAARGPQGARRAGLLAAASGVLYGFTAALTKTTGGLLGHGIIGAFGHWQPYALAACGALGLLMAQSAFQAGPLAASLPVLTVIDPIASIAIGAGAFGESLRTAPAAVVADVVGLVALSAGVFVLGRSPLVLAAEGEAAVSPPAGGSG